MIIRALVIWWAGSCLMMKYLLIWILASNLKTSCRLLARLPPLDRRLQRSVGREQRGLEGQVRHGAGFVLAPNPALDRVSLVGIPICGADMTFNTRWWCLSVGGTELYRMKWALFSIFRLTCGDDWIPHQLSGDWTQELIRGLWTALLCLQGLNFPCETTAEPDRLWETNTLLGILFSTTAKSHHTQCDVFWVKKQWGRDCLYPTLNHSFIIKDFTETNLFH